MDYTDYSAEDFLSDESFLSYCFNKNQADINFWESWIKNNPAKWDVFTEAKSTCYKLSIRLSPEEKEKEWEKLQEAMYTADLEGEISGRLPGRGLEGKKKSLSRRIMPLLAVCAAGVLFLSGIKWFNESFELQHRKPPVTYTSYTTGTGERRTIILPDGTNVLLNAGSRMDVPADYNQGQRNVLLQGDGFFEVAPDGQQPFSVTAKALVTTALGTSFRVRAYSFEGTIQVMLLTGKAKVSHKQTTVNPVPVYLTPGQEATLDIQEDTIQKGSFDIGQMNNWRAGNLVFKDATLHEIAATLQNWYGVKVVLAGNTSKKIHFNGEFDHEKDLPSVVKTVAFVNGMKYDLKENVLTLSVE